MRTVAKDPPQSTAEDLSKYIDKNKKIVRSITGETLLDYGNGYTTVNTPRSQGLAGDLASTTLLATASIRVSFLRR